MPGGVPLKRKSQDKRLNVKKKRLSTSKSSTRSSKNSNSSKSTLPYGDTDREDQIIRENARVWSNETVNSNADFNRGDSPERESTRRGPSEMDIEGEPQRQQKEHPVMPQASSWWEGGYGHPAMTSQGIPGWNSGWYSPWPPTMPPQQYYPYHTQGMPGWYGIPPYNATNGPWQPAATTAAATQENNRANPLVQGRIGQDIPRCTACGNCQSKNSNTQQSEGGIHFLPQGIPGQGNVSTTPFLHSHQNEIDDNRSATLGQTQVEQDMNKTKVNQGTGSVTDTVPLVDTSNAQLDYIEDSIKEKIWDNQFIELSKLIEEDNSDDEVSSRVTEVVYKGGQRVHVYGKAKTRKYLNYQEWQKAFLIFVKVYTYKHPKEASDLAQYMSQIHELKLKSRNWGKYDRLFRKSKGKREKSWACWDQVLFYDCLNLPQGDFKKSEGSKGKKFGDKSKRDDSYSAKSEFASAEKSKGKSMPFIPRGLCWKYHKGERCDGGESCVGSHSCPSHKSATHPAIHCSEALKTPFKPRQQKK
ncbi:unnamed protein product [Owenia fusiformis]|uniref:Uncharacterized protein n=1 Tax=Owenia fusiformis TaxID=6347 RepID=A0A8J1TX08_OWEFU|nr:unnamed protein product [Owenia fusiformis]